jgi:hypothetical protein
LGNQGTVDLYEAAVLSNAEVGSLEMKLEDMKDNICTKSDDKIPMDRISNRLSVKFRDSIATSESMIGMEAVEDRRRMIKEQLITKHLGKSAFNFGEFDYLLPLVEAAGKSTNNPNSRKPSLDVTMNADPTSENEALLQASVFARAAETKHGKKRLDGKFRRLRKKLAVVGTKKRNGLLQSEVLYQHFNTNVRRKIEGSFFYAKMLRLVGYVFIMYSLFCGMSGEDLVRLFFEEGRNSGKNWSVSMFLFFLEVFSNKLIVQLMVSDLMLWVLIKMRLFNGYLPQNDVLTHYFITSNTQAVLEENLKRGRKDRKAAVEEGMSQERLKTFARSTHAFYDH